MRSAALAVPSGGQREAAGVLPDGSGGALQWGEADKINCSLTIGTGLGV